MVCPSDPSISLLSLLTLSTPQHFCGVVEKFLQFKLPQTSGEQRKCAEAREAKRAAKLAAASTKCTATSTTS